MSTALDFLSSVLLGLGIFFIFSGTLGILRFPDFYTRLHAAGVTDTLGAALIVAGLMLQAAPGLAFFKLLMILLFILITSPTACHALSKAARQGRLEPESPRSGSKSDSKGILKWPSF